MGGVKFKNLNKITHDIWSWCDERKIWIFVSYIGSSENVKADTESRRLEPETEFSLCSSAFRDIINSFGEPEIDLFASRTNTKCKLYVSWFQDPNSFTSDAFTISWKKYFFYAFPPFAIILRVLRKIIDDKATGIIVVPNWPSQAWYHLFKSLRISKEIILKPRIDYLLVKT